MRPAATRVACRGSRVAGRGLCNNRRLALLAARRRPSYVDIVRTPLAPVLAWSFSSGRSVVQRNRSFLFILFSQRVLVLQRT